MSFDDFDFPPVATDVSSNQVPFSNLDVVIAIGYFYNVVPTTNVYSFIDKVSKSMFLDVDETKYENVNKGGCKASKYVKVWPKNAFNKWQKFWGYKMKKIHRRFV